VPTKKDQYADAMAAIQAGYVASLPGCIAAVAAPWAILRGAPSHEDRAGATAAMIKGAHGIAGTGATFGFQDLGCIAGDIERFFLEIRNRAVAMSEGELAEVGQLMAKLHCAAAQVGATKS